MIEIPIDSQRPTIRRFGEGDLDAYLQFMLDDASTQYLAFSPEQTTVKGATELFQQVIDSYDTPAPIHAYAIAEKSTGRYVGSCGWAPCEDGVVECYYCVNPESRGKGIASEAIKVLADALVRSVEVRAYCHLDNRAAHSVARNAGMKYQGKGRNPGSGLNGELFVCERKI